MLGGRGLGCCFSCLEGDDTLLRGDACFTSDRREDGDVGGEEGCSSRSVPILASYAGADEVAALLTPGFSVPLLSVRVCFAVRGVVPSGDCGPELTGFALLQSSLGTLVALPGAMRGFASFVPKAGIVASLLEWEGLETVFSATCAL